MSVMSLMLIHQKPDTHQPMKGHTIYPYVFARIARDLAPTDPGVGPHLIVDVGQGLASL